MIDKGLVKKKPHTHTNANIQELYRMGRHPEKMTINLSEISDSWAWVALILEAAVF